MINRLSAHLQCALTFSCLIVSYLAAAAPLDHKFDPDLQAQRSAGLPARITVIVSLRSQVDATKAFSLPARNAAVAATRQRALSSLTAGSYAVVSQWDSVAGVVIEMNSADLDKLAASPEVVRIGTNLGAGSGHLDESLELTGFDRVVSQLGFNGSGSRVAVLDTGYDTDHPSLANSLIGQKCFAEGGAACPGGPDSAEDDFGHGTWVSGVITSDGGPAPMGGAPGTEIYAVRVLDSNNSFSNTAFIVDGLDFVINSGIEFDAVNMSLGTFATFPGDCDNAAGFTMVLADAVNTLRAMGTLSIVSTGNAGNVNEMQAPACVASAISVGASHDGGPQVSPPCASTAVDTATCYSNISTTTDIFAPGSEIQTAAVGGGALNVHGTSFAAPHVTACVAALREAVPDILPGEIESALEGTASVQITAGGRSYPRLDCFAAVDSVRPVFAQTWHLDGMALSDGRFAEGSFLFDAVRGRYSDIDIKVYAADESLVTTYRHRLPVSPGNASVLLAVPDDMLTDYNGSPVLVIRWATPLSDAAGTRNAAAMGGLDGEGVCVDETCSFVSIARNWVMGRVVSAENYVERVTWYLQDVVFDDATPATGHFTFDNPTQSYFESEITTRDGSGGGGAVYRDPWPINPGTSRALRLVPDASLPNLIGERLLFTDWLSDTHAGGGVARVDVDGFSEENTICAADGNCWFNDRFITGGRAVAPLLDLKTCVNPGLAIPDGDSTGVSSDLVLPFDGSIVDFNVGLFVAHTYVGDLTLSIEHVETGTVIQLADRPGSPALGTFGCSGNDIDILIDDEGTAALEDTCEPTAPTLIGDLTPTSPLSAVDGENLGGTWRLNIADNEAADTGTLIEWCVDATVVSGPSGRDIDSDGVVDADDNCLLVEGPQTDADGDGFGNLCDADLNNDCIVNIVDLGILRSLFFTNPASPNWNPAADFNNDDVVNVVDLGLMRSSYFAPPGPSGIGNQCE